MARLMFRNNNEKNDDNSSSVIDNEAKAAAAAAEIIASKNEVTGGESITTAKIANKKIETFILRNRCEISSILSSHKKPTTKITNESKIARLASKFNAVMNVDETRDRNAPRALPNNKISSLITKSVRDSTVRQTIQFFEKDYSSNKAKSKKDTARLSRENKIVPVIDGNNKTKNSISKSSEFDQVLSSARNQLKSVPARKSIDSQKPSLQPKPILQNAPLDKKNISNGGRAKHHEPSQMGCDSNNTNSASEYERAMYKNQTKRLSIAKNFSLESVLNTRGSSVSDSTDIEIRNADEKPLQSAVCIGNNNKANNSFLHKYLEQCSESKITDVENTAAVINEPSSTATSIDVPNNDVATAAESDSPSLSAISGKNSSSLHNNLMKALSSMSNDGYEDLSPDTDGTRLGSADNHEYVDMNDFENDRNSTFNIYDDVVYSQLCNDDDAENYETISSASYGSSTVLRENVAGTNSDTMNTAQSSDSDSSFERTNSLYEIKRNSDFSSVFSSSNDCININIQSPRAVYITDVKSTSSGISDDWIDIDYWDSDDKDYKEIIVYRKRSNFSRLRKFKKRKFRPSTHKKDYVEVQPSENDINYTDELCDDFDDSSSDIDSTEMNERVPSIGNLYKGPLSNIHQSQHIYGLVKKARKTVRKSWSSLNQIRKISVSNISTSFPAKSQDVARNRNNSTSVEEINLKNSRSVENGGSVRWSSFKSKLRPRYSTIAASNSIFYLNPEDLCFSNNNNDKNKPSTNNNRRRRMTCVDLRPMRPTSPPPPPPVNRVRNENNSNSTSSNLNIYSDPSTSSYESRNSINGADKNSDLSSSRGSDLHLRFADEPLYQFYAESVAQLTTASLDRLSDSDGYEEIASTTSRPTAMELITPCVNGHGQSRSLWCEVSEVKNSGILSTFSISEQRLQEAKFEVITSEASYYKSLSVLDKIFVSNPLLKDETVLSKNDWKLLFGNVAAVRKCSEKLLAALEECWQESILLTGLCDVIHQHASENFKIYVKYCSNQIYIDRTLKKLRDQNVNFIEIINRLEANRICQSLTLHSFLMLPMQRITRMPLLIDAILSKLNPAEEDYKTYQITLATLNKTVKDCNETARKLEQYEEMLLLSRQLEFSRKNVKMFSIASSSRWLIRSGPMLRINQPDVKHTFTRKLTKQTTKIYFFLFNDVLIVAKKKSDDSFVVFDYCARNVMQMSLLEETNALFPTNPSTPYRYFLMLTMLENHEGKTIEMILSCDSDSKRQRWLEATSSHLTSDNPDEKLYEEWDCPQVSAVHGYTAVQPDELSLQAGDVVKVLKKTTDGWCHGERIRDGMTGWFPGNHTVEIASQHTRAKNLKLRHRLLTLSASYLQIQQQKKT